MSEITADITTKYNVVKILSVEREGETKSFKIIKLLRLKKPRNVQSEVINIDDDGDKENVIEITDSEEDMNCDSNNRFLNAAIRQASSRSSLQLPVSRAKTSPTKRKSVPKVISIFTDGVDNSNIHEEIEKMRTSLTEVSNVDDLLVEIDPTISDDLLVEIEAPETETLDAELKDSPNGPQTTTKLSSELLEKNADGAKRPFRTKRVPKKYSDEDLRCVRADETAANSSLSLGTEIKIVDNQKVEKRSSERSHRKRKSEDDCESQKPQKYTRRSRKSKDLAANNITNFGESTKIAENFQILRSLLESSKSIDNSSELVNKSNTSLQLYEQLTSQFEVNFSNQIVEKLSSQIGFENKSASALSHLNLEHRSEFESNQIFQSKVTSPKQEYTYPSEKCSKNYFLNFLKINDNSKTDQPDTSSIPISVPQATQSSEELKKQTSPKENYIMRLKCHRTCSNSKIHQKKHRHDVSSALGQKLCKRDAVDEDYVKNSLTKIEENSKTPKFETKISSIIHETKTGKVFKTPKEKFGRKSEVSEVLLMMKGATIERNVMRRGLKAKKFVTLQELV